MRKQSVTDEIAVISAEWPFVQIPTMLLADTNVRPGAKMTYAYLQLWGRRNGAAWPNRTRLAEAREISRATLYEHLAELDKAGWISRSWDGRKSVIYVNREGSRKPDRSSRPDSKSPTVRTMGSSQPDIEVDELKEKEEGEPSPPERFAPVEDTDRERHKRIVANARRAELDHCAHSPDECVFSGDKFCASGQWRDMFSGPPTPKVVEQAHKALDKASRCEDQSGLSGKRAERLSRERAEREAERVKALAERETPDDEPEHPYAKRKRLAATKAAAQGDAT